MKSEEKFIFVLFLLAVMVGPAVTFADDLLNTTREQLEQNQTLDSASEEEGTPIEHGQIYGGRSKNLKAGYTAIFENFQDFKDFIYSVNRSFATKKTEPREYNLSSWEQVDFNRQVIIIVVGPQLVDACKNSRFGVIKRFNSDQIQVTVETAWEKSCEPFPSIPLNALLGTVIDRPVKQVNVVFKDKIISLPDLEKKMR